MKKPLVVQVNYKNDIYLNGVILNPMLIKVRYTFKFPDPYSSSEHIHKKLHILKRCIMSPEKCVIYSSAAWSSPRQKNPGIRMRPQHFIWTVTVICRRSFIPPCFDYVWVPHPPNDEEFTSASRSSSRTEPMWRPTLYFQVERYFLVTRPDRNTQQGPTAMPSGSLMSPGVLRKYFGTLKTSAALHRFRKFIAKLFWGNQMHRFEIQMLATCTLLQMQMLHIHRNARYRSVRPHTLKYVFHYWISALLRGWFVKVPRYWRTQEFVLFPPTLLAF